MNEVKWMWSEVNFIVIKWSEYGEEVKWSEVKIKLIIIWMKAKKIYMKWCGRNKKKKKKWSEDMRRSEVKILGEVKWNWNGW